jgi:hypothetical protein
VPDTLSGSPIDLVKTNLALCLRGRNQVNSEVYKRNLQVTGPEWTHHYTNFLPRLIPDREQELLSLLYTRILGAWTSPELRRRCRPVGSALC